MNVRRLEFVIKILSRSLIFFCFLTGPPPTSNQSPAASDHKNSHMYLECGCSQVGESGYL